MAALLAHKALRVTTVEIDPRLAADAAAKLARNGVHNAHVEQGDGARGWPARAPYDAIVVSGGLPVLPQELLAQLRVGGRLAVIVGTGPVMQALLVTRVSESNYERLPLFETWTAALDNAPQPERFKF
jgi:protein-L-isoaspartate(D-aspartate) O-methyltransferase